MRLADLKARIPPSRATEVDALWAEYRGRPAGEEEDGFLAFLHERGVVDDALFRELHSADEIELMRLVGVRDDGTLAIVRREEPTVAIEEERATAPVAPQEPSASRYSVLGRLGRGAMGEVLVAKDRDLRRKVAFKRMIGDLAARADLADRFFSEVQVTAQLDHPNIVPIYGIEVSRERTLGYSMKLVQGKTLRELLEEAGKTAATDDAREEPKRLATRLEWFLKICDAIAYAHSKGVLHRDLKPENVMVGRYSQVYVMDWGLCRVLGRSEDVNESIVSTAATSESRAGETGYGAILGTPRYMSPEQAQGRAPELDARSDLYTLGLILQEVATLRPARNGASVRELLEKAARGDREAIAHANPKVGIARELVAIIEKATAASAAERYADVDALSADVRAFLRGDPVAAKPDDAFHALLRWIGRHRTATLGVLLVTLLAGAAATIAVLAREKRSLEEARRHELRVEAFVSAVSGRAHAMDGTFDRHEALLEGIVGRAAEILTRGSPPPDATFHLSSQFDAPGEGGPPDLAPSKAWGRLVSLDWPVFKVAPGIETASVRDDLRRLSELRPVLRQALVSTLGRQAREASADTIRKTLLEEGAPIHLFFVTLEKGVTVAYPGWGGYPEHWDGRKRPGYALGAGQPGMRWGNAYRSSFGRLLLPCARSVIDDAGRFLGVAGFQITFETLEKLLLEVSGDERIRQAYLVDGDGRTVVRSPHDEVAEAAAATDENDRLKLQPLPYPEVIRDLAKERTGYVETADGKNAIAFAPLESLGWTYVVVAERDELHDD